MPVFFCHLTLHFECDNLLVKGGIVTSLVNVEFWATDLDHKILNIASKQAVRIPLDSSP